MRQLDTLHGGFLRAAVRFPARVAIRAGSEEITYSELLKQACAISDALGQVGAKPESVVALYGGRTIPTYTALLGVLLAGCTYVPLSPAFPSAMNRDLLLRSNSSTLIVDDVGEKALRELLKDFPKPLTIFCPGANVSGLSAMFPLHGFFPKADGIEAQPGPRNPEADASYILFTSGSTGQPKGVLVQHQNVIHIINSLIERHNVSPDDRIAQLNDLTFDLSVAEMFTAWWSGATLCSFSDSILLRFPEFVRTNKVSITHTAPSIGLALHRLGKLTHNSMPSLRVSVFAGEALPAALVSCWSEAAPNAIVDNLYGPTECAVYVTGYVCDKAKIMEDAEEGAMPIGFPLPSVKVLVVDDTLREVPVSFKGELLIGGPQVASGYLNDPEKTAQAFVTPPGHSEVYYRTGDIARWESESGPLRFHGRKDHQVKILGMRIELGAVEAALREASGVMEVAALPWPKNETGYGGIIAFFGTEQPFDRQAVGNKLRDLLHRAILPKDLRVLTKLPLTTSGKVDRKALQKTLETPA
jgi:amino acid adenylation domain-containing protein